MKTWGWVGMRCGTDKDKDKNKNKDKGGEV